METRELIYQYIQEYIAEHGYSPSLRDIAKAVGVKSPSHVIYHVDRLAIEGRLTYEPRIARTIRLTGR